MIDTSNLSNYEKELGKLNSASKVVSASVLDGINQVFYADGISSVVSDAIDLSVRYVTADDFHKMIGGEEGYGDKFEPKTLYVVSSDQLNAYNTQIVNVAEPQSDTDAANKYYVDYACSIISGGGTIELTGYYKKTETSSSVEISTALNDALSSNAVKIGFNSSIAESNDPTEDIRSIAIGKNADASDLTYKNAQAVAIGPDSKAACEAAVAIGSQAEALSGGLNVAIGYRAKAEGKFSIAIGSAIGGLSANSNSQIKAMSNADHAVQIGLGINNTASSLQFLDYQLLDADGKIPVARLPASQTGISSVSASYVDGHIYLSADEQVVGDIDCTSFAKDGCLCAVELCSTQLVFTMTPDASVSSLSVDLSGLSGIGVTEKWVNDQISGMMTSSDISARYENNHIYLSAKGNVVGDIDCSDFLSDTYVSQAVLNGTKLVLNFNNRNVESISAELSSIPDSWAQTAEWIFDCN